MRTRIDGPALVLGDNVNTDILHPSRFFSLDDSKVRSGFLGAVDGREADGQRDLAGTLVVAGHNFGIGSSRETGARVFLLAGVQAIVAASFARIFYRNVMNLGLPAVVCPALANERPADGETVSLDLEASVLRIGDRELPTLAWDPHWQRICDAGGLAAWLGLSSSSRKDTTS